MAGVAVYDDQRDGHTRAIWDEGGLRFVSNILNGAGAKVRLHAHKHDHVSIITEGRLRVEETAPDGTRRVYVAASKEHPEQSDSVGYRFVIRAGHRHEFTLLSERGEVLCCWPPQE